MPDQQSTSEPQLPLTGKAAIYTRVATHAKRTHLPLTDDVLVLAQERGYTPEQITIYEDVGVVSGKTPMMSREGLRALVTLFKSRCMQGRLYRERQVQKRVLTRRTKKRNASGKDPTQRD